MSDQRRILPADVARCSGVGNAVDGWAEDCLTCRRRTDPPRGGMQWQMEPPRNIYPAGGACPFQIQEEGGEQK